MTHPMDCSGPVQPKGDIPWGTVVVNENPDAWEVVITVVSDDGAQSIRIEPEDLFFLRYMVKQAVKSFEGCLHGCPFCGGPASFIPLDPRNSGAMRVVCNDCGASSCRNDSLFDAISTWNRRDA